MPLPGRTGSHYQSPQVPEKSASSGPRTSLQIDTVAHVRQALISQKAAIAPGRHLHARSGHGSRESPRAARFSRALIRTKPPCKQLSARGVANTCACELSKSAEGSTLPLSSYVSFPSRHRVHSVVPSRRGVTNDERSPSGADQAPAQCKGANLGELRLFENVSRQKMGWESFPRQHRSSRTTLKSKSTPHSSCKRFHWARCNEYDSPKRSFPTLLQLMPRQNVSVAPLGVCRVQQGQHDGSGTLMFASQQLDSRANVADRHGYIHTTGDKPGNPCTLCVSCNKVTNCGRRGETRKITHHKQDEGFRHKLSSVSHMMQKNHKEHEPLIAMSKAPVGGFIRKYTSLAYDARIRSRN